MERVIYFVEDQEALTPYILEAREGDRFIGWKLLATDSIDGAIEWCEQSSGDAKVIFVVDSRMSSKLLPRYLEKVLADKNIAMQDISELVGNEVLAGALGTAVLKKLKPGCKTVLITAFFRTICELRREHPILDEILKESIDHALPKTSPDSLTVAIRLQITAL